jgi:dihydropteroate synthase
MLTLDYLARLRDSHPEAVRAQVREFSIGGRRLEFNSRPELMGVINLSPDSWYRESVCLTANQALARGAVLAAQGASILDVGAESTLAHARRVDSGSQEEVLLPVIRGLCQMGLLVSVETYDLSVSRACLDAGASVLNRTGTDDQEEVYQLVAERQAAVIICYVQGKNVREVGEFKFAADPVGALYEYFARETEVAARSGVEKMIIDPGLGFYYANLQDSSLRVKFQMNVFLNSFRLRTLGFPVCNALPHAFEYFGEEVRSAEPFFSVLAALGKTDLFRTHEVPKVKAVIDTLAAFDEQRGLE